MTWHQRIRQHGLDEAPWTDPLAQPRDFNTQQTEGFDEAFARRFPNHEEFERKAEEAYLQWTSSRGPATNVTSPHAPNDTPATADNVTAPSTAA